MPSSYNAGLSSELRKKISSLDFDDWDDFSTETGLSARAQYLIQGYTVSTLHSLAAHPRKSALNLASKPNLLLEPRHLRSAADPMFAAIQKQVKRYMRKQQDREKERASTKRQAGQPRICL